VHRVKETTAAQEQVNLVVAVVVLVRSEQTLEQTLERLAERE
jgi:hypothetical protein